MASRRDNLGLNVHKLEQRENLPDNETASVPGIRDRVPSAEPVFNRNLSTGHHEPGPHPMVEREVGLLKQEVGQYLRTVLAGIKIEATDSPALVAGKIGRLIEGSPEIAEGMKLRFNYTTTILNFDVLFNQKYYKNPFTVLELKNILES